MLSVKDDLLITTAFVGGAAFLFMWKRRFLIDFLIRREEHMARKNNPRQSKIGTRHSSSSEVLSNILMSSNEEQLEGANFSSGGKRTSRITKSRSSSVPVVSSFADYSNSLLVTSSSSSSNSNNLSSPSSAVDSSGNTNNRAMPGISSNALTVGNNDGSVFGIADRIPSFSLPTSSSSKSNNSNHHMMNNNDNNNNNNMITAEDSLVTSKNNRNSKVESKYSAKSALVASKNFNKLDLLLPGSSALFLMKGFDLSDGTFAPSVPHRHPSRPRGGPLAALLFPFQAHQVQHHQQQSLSDQLVVDAIALQQKNMDASFGSTNDHLETGGNMSGENTNSNSSSRADNVSGFVSGGSNKSSSSSWVEALLIASANVTSRGGERSSEDIERAIESLLFAKRRRQAFDAFNKDKDVPLKSETYDQLLRTFLNDRDHIFTILQAMETHGMYHQTLRSGERNSLVQAMFEALSIHDYKRAMSAFNLHHTNFLKNYGGGNNNNNNQKQSEHNNKRRLMMMSLPSSASSINNNNAIPVYSGLVAALIRRGMRKEAHSIISALNGTESERDVATGLIRCLHHEFELNLANRSSSSSANKTAATLPNNKVEEGNNTPKKKSVTTDAIDFTKNWLLSEEKKSNAKAVSSSLSGSQDLFFTTALQKSKVGVHARIACSVFAQHPNAFTCSVLTKFLLQHYPNGSTPVLKAAITASLFPTVVAAKPNTNQHHRHIVSSSPSSTVVTATAAATTASPAALHFARLSVSRAINRRGHWQLAASMAQQCLKSKTFEPVGTLAATVARHGKWSAALRLGTQLFALRRAPPTANELSLCVHSSLWSGKWSSALFWVERAHSRGLKFDSAVYDAAFVAAAAAAAASSSLSTSPATTVMTSNNNNNKNADEDSLPFRIEDSSKASSSPPQTSRRKLSQEERIAHANRLMQLTSSSSGGNNNNNNPGTRHNFDAAIRTVRCMAEMGGQCSGKSIEQLIATAAQIDPNNNNNNNSSRNNNNRDREDNNTIDGNRSNGGKSGHEMRSNKKDGTNNSADEKDGAPKIIDVLCDSGIVDWKL